MENASKALIIAGAILIAILLISVGIMVMNSMNKPLDQASQEADSQAVRMFNEKFSNYAGKGKKASDIKRLAEEVATTRTSSSSHKINMTITYKALKTGATIRRTLDALTEDGHTYTETDSASSFYILVHDATTYTVTLKYDTTGYINRIDILDEALQ